MKKILAITLAVLLTAFLSVLVVSAENSPSDAVVAEGEPVIIPNEENAVGKNYAGDMTFLDGARAFVLLYAEKIIIFIYAVYNMLPKIGAVARNKKEKSNLKAVINTYFGKDGVVLKLQNALVETQTKFMNDTSAVLAKIETATTAVEKIAKQYATAMEQRKEMKNLALACQGAVALMASQLNDLVMNSPSITAKKKAEIDAAWCERNAMLEKLVERMNSNDKQSENSAA